VIEIIGLGDVAPLA